MVAIGRVPQSRWILQWILCIFALYFCDRFSCGEKLTSDTTSAHWSTEAGETDEYEVEYNLQTTQMTWWEAAQGGCDQYGGDLFTLKSEWLPKEVSSRLFSGIFWIGAVEISTWKWTDGSGLYIYEGYIQVPSDTSGFSIPGNSPLACHQKCGQSKERFGLRGSTCYCFITKEDSYDKDHKTEVRCPGNYYYKCGDSNGMSVYSIVRTVQTPDDLYYCGYVKARRVPSHALDLHLSTSCENSRCGACNITEQPNMNCSSQNSMCVVSLQMKWDLYNSVCPLGKITSDIKATLLDLILKDGYNGCDESGYWVGLKRYSDKKWIDGRNVNVSDDKINTSFPRCLTIKVDNDLQGSYFYKPYWTSCSSKYRSVCETIKYTSTTSATTSPLSSMTANAVTERSTTSSGFTSPTTVMITSTTTSPLPSMTAEAVTERSTSSSTSNSPSRTSATQTFNLMSTSDVSSPHTPTILRDQQDHNKIGVYLGSGIGGMAIVAFLLMAIISYRHRWLCFKALHASNGYENTNAKCVLSSERVEIVSDSQISSNSRTHQIPIATVRPICQNVSLKDIEPEKRTDYYNIRPEHLDYAKSRPYNLADQSAHLGGVINLSTETTEIVRTTQGGSNGKGLTNVAYNSIGESIVNQQKTKHTDIYDHAGVSTLNGQIGQKDPFQETNTAYNHIGEINVSFSGIESDYDSTRHGHVRPDQTSALSSDYSHTSEFRTGAESNQDEYTDDNIYHELDEDFIEERRDWSARGQDLEQTQAALPENSSYYNVVINPDTGSDNKRNTGSEDVYSKARAISEA